jgi:RNA polymerase sigma-70 factor (ECF subfamily)
MIESSLAQSSHYAHAGFGEERRAYEPMPRTATHANEESRATTLSMSPEQSLRFRALVDAHFAFIWRYLRGLGVLEAHADDASQHVFLVVLQKLDAIAPGSERSFLIGTALGVAANARRAQSRQRDMLIDAPIFEHRDERPDPEEQAQSKEAVTLLDQFLSSLSDDLRDVFILFELEGMTMAEIAESTGTAPGTVASRLRRAREEFQAAAKRLQATTRRMEGGT